MRQRAYVGKHRRPAAPSRTPGTPAYAASLVLAAAAAGGLNVQPAAGVGTTPRAGGVDRAASATRTDAVDPGSARDTSHV
ncbi:MAG: hypothetical protein M3P48_07750, partial [Actinomycetota bacterium]|nr:hypothetical protein [Actinomycetota bacterium]